MDCQHELRDAKYHLETVVRTREWTEAGCDVRGQRVYDPHREQRMMDMSLAIENLRQYVAVLESEVGR